MGLIDMILGKYVWLPRIDAPKNDLSGLEWHSYQVNGEQKFVPLKFYGLPNSTNLPTIIYSHGNQDDLESIDDLVTRLSLEIGCNFLTYEYPGYGVFKKPEVKTDIPSSPIEYHCSEAGCNDAIRGAYDYLNKKKGMNPKQIFLWGMSLGTGPSVDLACDTTLDSQTNTPKFPLGGMILQSGFLSILRIPIHLAVPLNFLDMFISIDKLPNVTCPLALIHGENDKTIPVSHSHEMMKLVKFSPFLRIPGGEHNLFLNPDHFTLIVKFVKELIIVMTNRNAKSPLVETKDIEIHSLHSTPKPTPQPVTEPELKTEHEEHKEEHPIEDEKSYIVEEGGLSSENVEEEARSVDEVMVEQVEDHPLHPQHDHDSGSEEIEGIPVSDASETEEMPNESF